MDICLEVILGSWMNDCPRLVPGGISPVVAYLSDSMIVCEIKTTTNYQLRKSWPFPSVYCFAAAVLAQNQRNRRFKRDNLSIIRSEITNSLNRQLIYSWHGCKIELHPNSFRKYEKTIKIIVGLLRYTRAKDNRNRRNDRFPRPNNESIS